MSKVGDREIAFHESFIVPYGESISFSAQIKGTTLPVEISITEQECDDKSPAAWRFEEGKLFLTFYGFKLDPQTRLMQVPAKIGDIGGEALTISSSIYRHSLAYLVHIQIMVGGHRHE